MRCQFRVGRPSVLVDTSMHDLGRFTRLERNGRGAVRTGVVALMYEAVTMLTAQVFGAALQPVSEELVGHHDAIVRTQEDEPGLNAIEESRMKRRLQLRQKHGAWRHVVTGLFHRM